MIMLSSWVAMGIESLCTSHMAHSRCFLTVRRADDACVGSEGLCTDICPWGHHSGRCWGGVVCGQDAHSGALSVPGHVGGGLGWRRLSCPPPQAPEEAAQWGSLRRLSGFI